MNNKNLILMLLISIMPFLACESKNYQLLSPNKQIKIEISLGKKIGMKIYDQKGAIMNSSISMTLKNGEVLGLEPKLDNARHISINNLITSPFYKKDKVKDNYNQLMLSLKGDYGLIFRAYDEGVAYRFFTKKKGYIIIENEEANYQFPDGSKAFAAYVNNNNPTFESQFFNSFEQPYVHDSIALLNDKRLKILPLLVDLNDGRKICITESDLENYPGMFLNNEKGTANMKGVFAPYPKVKKQGGHNNLQMLVAQRENYIAKSEGTRDFPWRVFVVSNNDMELANSDMVYRLASPSRISDTSWIKPGKVAWDWWNDWNIYGVDFKSGVNNPTYKYYIDFASKYGIEYVILDEGWAVNGKADMMQVIPEIDLKELIEYGKSKNVGIILWAGYWAFARDMENIVKHYADMGVKGFKVDFLDRDDQDMVDFVYKASDVCAKNKMILDFHGVFKPTGLQRTYPNVLNYEGVNGLEQLKWSHESYDMPKYDVTIPFIRMVAGPMDYTQGAMRNATKGNYHPVNSEPMSQGTRCHQLATYVIFESPFNMLCDAPSNYMKEPECTEFIANIPTVWDETVSIDGKVGEYVAMARRNGDSWYVGALTDWDSRDITLDLSFLAPGDYIMEVFKDGINADRVARDYKKEIISVATDRKIKIHMAPGGGCAMKIAKRK